LEINSCKIKHLQLANCPKLEILIAYNNDLTEIELSHLNCLRNAFLNNNQLKKINLAPNIERIYLMNNYFHSLSLDKSRKIKTLVLRNNLLTSLEISHLADLEYLDCATNCLNKLNCNNLTNLEYLDCSQNTCYKNKYLEFLDSEPVKELSKKEILNYKKKMKKLLLSSRSVKNADIYQLVERAEKEIKKIFHYVNFNYVISNYLIEKRKEVAKFCQKKNSEREIFSMSIRSIRNGMNSFFYEIFEEVFFQLLDEKKIGIIYEDLNELLNDEAKKKFVYCLEKALLIQKKYPLQSQEEEIKKLAELMEKSLSREIDEAVVNSSLLQAKSEEE
jgi:hypothetical protein